MDIDAGGAREMFEVKEDIHRLLIGGRRSPEANRGYTLAANEVPFQHPRSSGLAHGGSKISLNRFGRSENYGLYGTCDNLVWNLTSRLEFYGTDRYIAHQNFFFLGTLLSHDSSVS